MLSRDWGEMTLRQKICDSLWFGIMTSIGPMLFILALKAKGAI